MQDSFDFIIVGAGSAGCVLANRLSKDPANSVLLIEAGGKDKDPLLSIPGAYIKLFRSKNDWKFRTTPQTHVLDREIYLPRGKTLGGSSSTNAMAYVRGNPADYEHWGNLGNDGWDFQSVKPYFLRSEHHEQADQLDPAFHNKGGELHVTREPKFQTPYADAFIAGSNAIGLPLNKDYNGASQIGVGRVHYNIKGSVRHSAATAFLKPVLNRPNLTVFTRTSLSRIMLKDRRATGVEIIRNGKKSQLKANREIVLSAGAFHSPQLLMLSGIGDPEELKSNGIEVRHSLIGMGKNLQDHLMFPISATAKSREGLNKSASMWGQLKGITKYFIRKQGPFTTSPLEAFAFFNLDEFTATPNFQFHFTPMHPGRGYGRDFYDIRTFVNAKDGFTLLPSLLNPKSRGTVSLNGPDPFSAPIIDPRFLSANEDLEDLIKGGKIALKVLQNKAFASHLDEFILPTSLPKTDEEWAHHIKQSVETIYHPVGTCKMGNDELAVTDASLKVRGLQNLRVADASIMPTIVTGNTNAPVYMIAEKAADMILGK